MISYGMELSRVSWDLGQESRQQGMQGVFKVLRVGTGVLRHLYDTYINLSPTSKLRGHLRRGGQKTVRARGW